MAGTIKSTVFYHGIFSDAVSNMTHCMIILASGIIFKIQALMDLCMLHIRILGGMGANWDTIRVPCSRYTCKQEKRHVFFKGTIGTGLYLSQRVA